MNEIKDCIDALLAAVQNSEEYQEFIKYKEILEQDPELLSRVNAFRANNFKLQNEANRDELFRVTEQLTRESRELRKIPQVNAFLDAELALCKLLQRICKTLTEGIDLEVPECQRDISGCTVCLCCSAGLLDWQNILSVWI